ncbi:MAG: glycosyltransferase [Pseudomonadota bacterium]
MPGQKGIMLYDFLALQGGAEKLTLTLLASLPDVPLCCAFRDKTVFSDRILPKAGFLDLNAASGMPPWRLLKVIWAFEIKTQFLTAYDWVLFSGVYAPLAVRNHPIGTNLLYCHTIPRFAYDLKTYYMSRLPLHFRPAFYGLTLLMRHRYQRALAHMDIIIANSNNVKKRLENYLGRSAIVIHPPVDTDRFRWIGQKDYYVSLARLENFKQVDLIVNAFRQMPEKNLVVTSSGSEIKRLRALAADAPNIRFTGWQTEEQLKHWIGNSIAAVYIPIDEDFGISPVESMAAGKPVIGVAEGGLLETIVPNQTGILLHPPPTVDAISAAVRNLTPKRALEMRPACEARARLFTREIFLEKMRTIIDSKLYSAI